MSKEKPAPGAEKPQENNKNPAEKPIEKQGFKDKGLPEPTRYGDWEVGGRCSDF